MSSHLKRIRVGSKIHTGFAWLGHGTIIQQAHAQQFLSLMNILNASTEELKMADNYFTLLSNSFPQVWLDQGIELGGGQPFTVGEEGDDRNKRHILRATQMLDQLLDCTSPPCIKTDDVLPYVALDDGDQQTITRTPCIGTPCVLETSISPFIDHLRLDAPSATSLLEIESVNRKSVNEDMPDYLQNPFSHAVDSNPKTAFCASKGAKANDSIVLDLLQQTPKWKHTDLVILVDKVSEEILVQALAIESAHAGGEWVSLLSFYLACKA
ncbi:hypothetical protein VKT23_005461 [Stygiomarasmius scandens]|uniref:Uncharacterized protein n=1 Tax=Marasmiellus scandens TaxID=2682957 RepID=A0ABR1JSU8_9AGAR